MYHRNRVFFIHMPFIESAIIEHYHSENFNDHYSSHTWNEDNYDFDQQLKNGCGKIIII